jgi:uncharacterized protein
MRSKTAPRLPGEADCLALMNQFEMPPHVIAHSRTVCGVAMYLTRALNANGAALNPELVRAAALLHDITKRFSFNQRLDHALTGAKLLRKIGYAEIASVVRQHVRLSKSRPPGRISEAEVVNYADKRVVEDQVTSLTDRINYIKERYGRTPEALAVIDRFSAQTFQIEKDIFALIPGDPVDLMSLKTEEECRL